MKKLISSLLIVCCILTAILPTVPVMANNTSVNDIFTELDNKLIKEQGQDYFDACVYRVYIKGTKGVMAVYCNEPLVVKPFSSYNNNYAICSLNYDIITGSECEYYKRTYAVLEDGVYSYHWDNSSQNLGSTDLSVCSSKILSSNHDIYTSDGTLFYAKTIPQTTITQDDVTGNTVSTEEIEVSAEVNSQFTVGIPISASINKETGQGTYKTSVAGDLDSRYKLVVKPIDGYTTELGDTTENINFLLEDQSDSVNKKDSVVVDLTVGKTEFVYTDINLETPVEITNTMNVSEGELSAGEWKGVIKYSISLEEIE